MELRQKYFHKTDVIAREVITWEESVPKMIIFHWFHLQGNLSKVISSTLFGACNRLSVIHI